MALVKPTIVGSATSGSGANVAFPSHQAGDLLVIFAARNIASQPILNVSLNPVPPAAGGTVPQYVDIHHQMPVQNSYTCCQRVVYAWATANNHTTGAWTQTTNMVVYVVRGADPNTPVSGKSWKTGMSSNQPLLPGVTLRDANDTSVLLRMTNAMSTASMTLTLPASHTQRLKVDSATSCILAASKDNTSTAPDAAATSSLISQCWAGSSVEIVPPYQIGMNVLQSGGWKKATPKGVLQGGAWNEPTRVWALQDGVWKLAWENPNPPTTTVPDYLYGVKITYLDNWVVQFNALKGWAGQGYIDGDEAFMFRCVQLPRDGYVARDFTKTWATNGYGSMDCTLEDLYGYGGVGEKNTKTILRFRITPRAVGNGVVEEYLAATPEFVNPALAAATALPIKAVKSSGLYHTPDSPYYNQTSSAVVFPTEEDAQAAGYTKWVKQ